MRPILSVIFGAAAVSASFEGNLNYLSPSRRHEALGIALHKVVKRQEIGLSHDPSALNFTHGVASGDPYPDSVILWTRVAPASDNDRSNVTVDGYAPLYGHETEIYIKASKAPVCVEYEIAEDRGLSKVADSGQAYTSSDVDYTVKVSFPSLPVRFSTSQSFRVGMHMGGGGQAASILSLVPVLSASALACVHLVL